MTNLEKTIEAPAFRIIARSPELMRKFEEMLRNSQNNFTQPEQRRVMLLMKRLADGADDADDWWGGLAETGARR